MKKFLFDLFPLILFFIAFKFADIYIATGVAMAAAILQLVWIKARGKKIEGMHWINLGVIVVFGGMTLWLKDEAFIKWKPTVLYWLFGSALLISKLFMGRNLMQKLLGEKISMSDLAWTRMNASWAVFFLCAGGVNLFVAFSGLFTTDQWVSFKVFGLMGLLLVFVIGQSIWLGKHIHHPEVLEPVTSKPDTTKHD